MVEPPLVEDVFVCCTRFLRMYIHRVSSRHLAITTHPPRCCEDRARLVADKLANGKEPKEARRPAPHNRYRDGAPNGESPFFETPNLSFEGRVGILASSGTLRLALLIRGRGPIVSHHHQPLPAHY